MSDAITSPDVRAGRPLWVKAALFTFVAPLAACQPPPTPLTPQQFELLTGTGCEVTCGGRLNAEEWATVPGWELGGTVDLDADEGLSFTGVADGTASAVLNGVDWTGGATLSFSVETDAAAVGSRLTVSLGDDVEGVAVVIDPVLAAASIRLTPPGGLEPSLSALLPYDTEGAEITLRATCSAVTLEVGDKSVSLTQPLPIMHGLRLEASGQVDATVTDIALQTGCGPDELPTCPETCTADATCRVGACSPMGGCGEVFADADTPCDDGRDCTTGEVCDAMGSCLFGSPDALCVADHTESVTVVVIEPSHDEDSGAALDLLSPHMGPGMPPPRDNEHVVLPLFSSSFGGTALLHMPMDETLDNLAPANITFDDSAFSGYRPDGAFGGSFNGDMGSLIKTSDLAIGPNGVTVSAWLRPAPSGGPPNRIVPAVAYSTGNDGNNFGIGTGMNSWWIMHGEAMDTEICAAKLNVFSHLAVTYDAKTGVVLGYCNGALTATVTFGGIDAPFQIGTPGPGGGASIDDVLVLPYAASANEIATLAIANRPAGTGLLGALRPDLGDVRLMVSQDGSETPADFRLVGRRPLSAHPEALLYWSLDEGLTPDVGDAQWSGDGGQAAAGGPFASGGQSRVFDAGLPQLWTDRDQSSLDVVFGLWFRYRDAGGASAACAGDDDGDVLLQTWRDAAGVKGHGWQLRLCGGEVRYDYGDPTGIVLTLQGPLPADDGRWHHVLVGRGSVEMELFVEGARMDRSSADPIADDSLNPLTPGLPTAATSAFAYGDLTVLNRTLPIGELSTYVWPSVPSIGFWVDVGADAPPPEYTLYGGNPDAGQIPTACDPTCDDEQQRWTFDEVLGSVIPSEGWGPVALFTDGGCSYLPGLAGSALSVGPGCSAISRDLGATMAALNAFAIEAVVYSEVTERQTITVFGMVSDTPVLTLWLQGDVLGATAGGETSTLTLDSATGWRHVGVFANADTFEVFSGDLSGNPASLGGPFFAGIMRVGANLDETEPFTGLVDELRIVRDKPPPAEQLVFPPLVATPERPAPPGRGPP